MFNKIKNYISFTKPGISRAQILTVSIGYFLAKQSIAINLDYLYLIIATYLFSASACGANNFLEKKYDAKMKRTENRELVTGAMSSKEAIFVITITFIGATFYVLKLNIENLLL